MPLRFCTSFSMRDFENNRFIFNDAFFSFLQACGKRSATERFFLLERAFLSKRFKQDAYVQRIVMKRFSFRSRDPSLHRPSFLISRNQLTFKIFHQSRILSCSLTFGLTFRLSKASENDFHSSHLSFAVVRLALLSKMNSEKVVAYFYDEELGNYSYGDANPMRPHRLRLTHNLVEHYGLTHKLFVHRPKARDVTDMTEFHADGRISAKEEFMKTVPCLRICQILEACDSG